MTYGEIQWYHLREKGGIKWVSCRIKTKTLKNEPDDDFTKPNLTQWDKEQKIPLIDGNGCAVIMCKVIIKTEMILIEAEYSVRTGNG